MKNIKDQPNIRYYTAFILEGSVKNKILQIPLAVSNLSMTLLLQVKIILERKLLQVILQVTF